MANDNNMQVESLADFGTGTDAKKGWAKYLKTEIHASEKDERVKKWRERGDRVIRRYRDDRDSDSAFFGGQQKRYNILWSNVQTMLPAVFGRRPEPMCARRYSDPDNVARVAALILERVLTYQICAQRDFVDAVRSALQDRLLPGMGTLWVRYQMDDASPAGDITNDLTESKAAHRTAVDYVYWQDFGFVPSRTWEEVPCVWRRVYLSRDDLIRRFGEEIGKAVPLNYTPKHHAQKSGTGTDEPTDAVFKQAEVYEVWDKRRKVVTWINMEMDDPLDVREDPYGFPNFFPCPKPLFATNTTGNLTPVPDYVLYQDQATELDTITQRLHMLTISLKVVGVYDAEQTAVQRMLTEGVENQLIPVDTWAAFAEKGGIKGVVDFLPLEKVIEVITNLANIRTALIQDIYQITGISDIIRGASSPRATATEQRIKAQYASIRLDDLKVQMAQFVTDAFQLMSHLAVKFFPPEVLVAQSAIMQSIDGQKSIKDAQAAKMKAQQAQQPPQPGMPQQPPAPPPPQPVDIIMEAVQLLKSDLLGYRVEVVSESLVEPDLVEERQQRTEFMTALTQFLQQAIPGVQQVPELAPLLQGLLMWSVRGFRVGRDVEGLIETSMNAIISNPKPQQPDPKVEALKMKAQLDQQKAQADIQADRERMQMEREQMQQEIAADREKNQAQIQAMMQKAAADIQALREKAAAEIEIMREKAAIEGQVKMQSAALDASVKQQSADIDLQAKERAAEQGFAHSEQQHELALTQAADKAKAAEKNEKSDTDD
jgi:hypothetical protein